MKALSLGYSGNVKRLAPVVKVYVPLGATLSRVFAWKISLRAEILLPSYRYAPMNRIIAVLIPALLLLMSWGGVAADSAWELKKDKDAIQIFARSFPGSDIDQIRAITRVNGTAENIVALLQDMEFWPELNKIFSLAQVHKRLNASESLVYLRMDMPWPVRDRDVLIRRRVSRNCVTGVMTIEDVATRNILPVNEHYVRIVESTQLWTLTPQSDGSVLVEWVTHTDPNGPIPASVINFLSISAPFDSLATLRRTIEHAAVKIGHGGSSAARSNAASDRGSKTEGRAGEEPSVSSPPGKC